MIGDAPGGTIISVMRNHEDDDPSMLPDDLLALLSELDLGTPTVLFEMSIAYG